MTTVPIKLKDQESSESAPLKAPIHEFPLLSIVVPVYNGSNKVETALTKLKSQIEELQPVVAKLEGIEIDSHKVEASPLMIKVNTGRKIIENASAALLFDQYLEAVAPSLIKLENGGQMFGTASEQSGQPADSVGQDKEGQDASAWYEIIVVNDGSKDNTRSIVENISRVDEKIRLISYSINMGKGYAVKQGVLHSRGKYVMFLDGDGEISTEVLSKYLERMAGADIAIGSKYHPMSIVKTSASRRVFSKGFQLFVKLMLKTKVSDTQVGLKVGKGDTFRKIFQKVIVKRYAFDAEMLTVAGLLGVKVVELPVQIELEKSFKKKEIVRMAIDVLGIAFRSRVIKWYQKNMGKQRPYYRALAFA